MNYGVCRTQITLIIRLYLFQAMAESSTGFRALVGIFDKTFDPVSGVFGAIGLVWPEGGAFDT